MNKINKKIIFTCLPPITQDAPFPAYSVIKAFFKKNGYTKVEVKYWNVLFKKIYDEYIEYDKEEDDIVSWLLPFLWQFAIEHEAIDIQRQLELYFFDKSSAEVIADIPACRKIITALTAKIFKLIDEEIRKIDFNNILFFGLSCKVNQWIPASLVARIVKKRAPNIPIIIGGFTTKNEAMAIMKMFSVFDFAIWGEGEYPLLELSNSLLSNKKNYQNIPRLIYREIGQKLTETNFSDKFYLDLDTILPDHEDYFEAVIKNNISKINIRIGVENGRGCIWDRCKFCVFSKGYRCRTKNIAKITAEIEYMLNKYKICNFELLGTDIGGFVSPKTFERFIDTLIEINNRSEDELLFLFDITPKKFNKQILAKISLLNYKCVIGLEATSDVLLEKMDKINRFADNLLFLKFAYKYNMLKNITGKIIDQIPGETSTDVNEAAFNLSFMRFFLGPKNFSPLFGPPLINKATRFFEYIPDNETKYWDQCELYGLLPPKLFTNIDRFNIFPFMSRIKINQIEWDRYKNINNSYLKHDYCYKIFRTNDEMIYKEYCDEILSKTLVFDDMAYINILIELNDVILSFDQLYSKAWQNNPGFTKQALKEHLKELYDENLIYYSKNFEQIISVIDIDQAIIV